MNSKTIIFFGLAVFSCHYSMSWLGFGSQNKEKNRVNFYGTIQTDDGKKIIANNISISNKYKDISVYAVPSKSTKRTVPKDPRKGIVTKINLADIATITVPKPNQIWTYQRNTGLRKTKYIEIIVSFNGSDTNNHYLVEERRKILCDELVPSATPIQKIIPFTEIKLLRITKHEQRKETKKIKRKKSRTSN